MIAPEIKKILKEMLVYKKTLIVIAIAGIINAIAYASMIKLIKDLVDSMTPDKLADFQSIGLTILSLAFVAGSARYFHIFSMNMVAEKFSLNMRHRLQKKFMNLNLTFHNTFASGSGGLISRILNDMMIVQNGLRMFADFFREPIMLVALLGWLFYLNWQLTATIFIVLPLILLFLRQISKTIKTHSVKGQEDLELLTGTIKESLDGVRVIQSFNLEGELSNRFLQQADRYLYSRKKLHSRVEMSGPVTEFVTTALVLGILGYIGMEISAGRATYGTFVGYVTAMLGLSAPIKKLQESYVRIQEVIIASRRVYAILEDTNEVPQTISPQPFPSNWKTITYKNVSFRYGEEWILRNVNLTIQRGEVVAFVGASGSGKSTLVNLLERFFDPSEGQILIDNTSILDFDLKDLRNHIALVTQDVFLFSDTIERNIWSGDFAKPKERVMEAAKSANTHDFIMRTPLGYQNRVGDRGGLLSGGEKQRVSIARAILKDAPLLILDEATSALDSASEIEVQKGLDRLMQGRTALVIAHRLSTITKADKIVVLRQGEIVEVGNHETLLANNGEYATLHRLQNR